MKIPKSVMVYGSEYRIDITKMDIENDGFCINSEALIQLSARLKARDRLEVLLHECLHAVIHRTGITQGIEDGLEEALCQSIAQWINETFHLRPKKGTTPKN